MRRGLTGVLYTVLAIAFLYAGSELLIHFHRTLLCDITIVGFALGAIRAARLGYDAFTGSSARRITPL